MKIFPKRKHVIITHERYYVYLLTVGSNIFYYGVTCDLSARLKEHKRQVQRLMDSKEYTLLPSQTKALKVHHKMASKIMRSGKYNHNTCQMNMATCYVTDCLDDAKEVEIFLIKKAKKRGLCYNTKETL